MIKGKGFTMESVPRSSTEIIDGLVSQSLAPHPAARPQRYTAINPMSPAIADGTYMRLRAIAEKEDISLDTALRNLLDEHLQAQRDYEDNEPYNCETCGAPMRKDVGLCEGCRITTDDSDG